jgi:hypothetical protein
MIKPYMSLLMYSGLQNPEIILSKEQEQKVLELTRQLDEPYQPPRIMVFGHDPTINCMGQDCYFIYWYDMEVDALTAFTTPFEGDIMGLHVFPNGLVRVYSKGNLPGKLFQDTVGLWKYLHPEGEKLVARHFRDANEAMDDYYEKVLGIPR